MLGERQVAASLMAQRSAHGALGLAHRRFQPGQGVGIQLAGFRLSAKPQRPSQCQFGDETLVLAFALFAPAASRPGQHCAVRRQRGRQAAPCGHTSTVGQRFLCLVLGRDAKRHGWSIDAAPAATVDHRCRYQAGTGPDPGRRGASTGRSRSPPWLSAAARAPPSSSAPSPGCIRPCEPPASRRPKGCAGYERPVGGLRLVSAYAGRQ